MAKITLDLTDLVARGALSEEEAARLSTLAQQDTGALGANILLSFGIVAVALGAGVMLPNALTVVVVGALLFGLGLALRLADAGRWGLVSQVSMTIGALAIFGGVSFLSDGSVGVSLLIALGVAAAAALARSGLLAAVAVLVLVGALGGRTSYWHATYGLGIPAPALTIGVLAALTLALYLVSLRVPPAYERVALIGARTAILMTNFAFLIGSLFGDPDLNASATTFSIVWALALLAIGGWAIWANRRWVVNASAVFGAIHFYTQWFESLGLSPLSIVGGGLLLIGFGFALRWFNQQVLRRAAAATPPSAANEQKSTA